jgi:isopenicillin-N epimerase
VPPAPPAPPPSPPPAEDLRQAFLLRPGVVFLNHGSFGACPRPVFAAYQEWQRELEAQPVEFLGRRGRGLLAEARRALGAYVGAAADDLVYVPNSTFALNVVARALPLTPGDEVLATDHEYGAMERAWTFVCERRGARYVRQPVPLPCATEDEVVQAVWAGVTPRTRVLFLSHITSPTALIFPVAALVRRAREAGILTVVDGAHAPGQVPLDLRALGADFYVANCHKWLCAPKGSAFLYARREAQELLSPLVVSWGWRGDGSVGAGSGRFVDEQQWQGTRDLSPFLAVPAALEFLRGHDWPAVQRACHARLARARREVAALTGLPPLCPDSPRWYAQMAALPIPPCDGPALQRRLYETYAIEVPVVSWQGRTFVRVSIQAYNSEADVEALVEALATLLPALPAPPPKA